MKNLIRSFAILALIFNGYSSGNPARTNNVVVDKQAITTKQRIENLKKEFANGTQEVLKNLQDKKGDGAEVADPANEYIVCFEQKKVEGKGERLIRIVHPDAAKITGDAADVTENQVIAPIVKDFFEKVKASGEADVSYEISGNKYYASVMDVGFSDPKTEKGQFICVAVSNKDYKNDHAKADDKKEVDKVDNKVSSNNNPENTQSEKDAKKPDDSKTKSTDKTQPAPVAVEADKSKQADQQPKEANQKTSETIQEEQKPAEKTNTKAS
jgi:hypothetical protein